MASRIEEAVLRMEAWVTSQIATALKISIFNRALCTSSMLARAEILIRYYGRTKVYAMDHRARLLENGVTRYPAMPSDLDLIIYRAILVKKKESSCSEMQMQVQYYCWLFTKHVPAVLC